jgi:hypothetical protein
MSNSSSSSTTFSVDCLVNSEISTGNGAGDDESAQLMLHLPHDLFARGVAQFLSLEDKRCMRQASRCVCG